MARDQLQELKPVDDFSFWRGAAIDLADAPQAGHAIGITLGTGSGDPNIGCCNRWTAPLPAFLEDTEYILKWEVNVGAIQRAKVWKAGDPEPAWQASAVHPGGGTFSGLNSELPCA